MVRIACGFCAAVILVSCYESAAAQWVTPRAQDYLFVTNSVDPRGLWVNPAGMGVTGTASIMAELSTVSSGSDVRVDQFSLGLYSGGMALGYRSARPEFEANFSELKIASTYPFEQGTVGFSATRYSQDSVSAQGFDIGAVFVPNSRFQAGLVIRNIGRPTLLTSQLPLEGSLGLQLTGRRFQIAGEASSRERLGIGNDGYDFSYRIGSRFSPSRNTPAQILATAGFDSNFQIRQIHLGVSVGRTRRVIAVATASVSGGTVAADHFSAAFLAVNPATGRR